MSIFNNNQISIEQSEISYLKTYYFIFSIYCAYQLLVFMHAGALAPDEIAFFNASNNFQLFSRLAPPFDYGSIYWELLDQLRSIYVIRFVFAIFYISIPFLILSNFRYGKWKLIGCVFYLSMPFAFWNGKLIGPEILSIFLLCLALNFRNKWLLSSMLVGFGIGVKLTSAPFAFFFVSLFLFDKELKIVIKVVLGVLFGFIFANPVNSDIYVLHVIQNSSIVNIPAGITLESIKWAYFHESWTWDNLLQSSFSQMILHPIILFFYLALLLFSGGWRIVISVTIFFLATIFFSSKSAVPYAWYFLAAVPALLFSMQFFEKIKVSEQRYLFILITLIVLICLNFYLNLPISVRMMAEKWGQINTLKNFPLQCLTEQISKYNPEHIVEKTEFGNAAFIPIIANKPIPLSTGYGAKFDVDKRSMMLISTRFLGNPYHLESSLPNDYPIKKFAVCGNIFVFVNQ